MLTNEMREIVSSSSSLGWIMEPQAKKLFKQAGLDVPQFLWTQSPDEAMAFAEKVGYPIVAKVVSPMIVHKSDAGGVIAGIRDEAGLLLAIERLRALKGYEGVLVEESLSGIELIVGAKIDFQFGPVVLVGMGGTSTEIYKDTALRMAPLTDRDVVSMILSLKGRPLLEGFRGSEPINMEALIGLLVRFSMLVADMEDLIESIDLNPVFCSAKRCVIADARIMLKKEGS
jgi:acetate---CoA ligase (ADP-forming) subunit beta